MTNGHKSNGVTTERGRLTIIGAGTSNGAQSFSPVLPGIETQEEWDEHLAGIQAGLSPVGHLESELAYKVALTVRQWHRLDRCERAATLQQWRKPLKNLSVATKRRRSWRPASRRSRNAAHSRAG